MQKIFVDYIFTEVIFRIRDESGMFCYQICFAGYTYMGESDIKT